MQSWCAWARSTPSQSALSMQNPVALTMLHPLLCCVVEAQVPEAPVQLPCAQDALREVGVVQVVRPHL